MSDFPWISLIILMLLLSCMFFLGGWMVGIGCVIATVLFIFVPRPWDHY